MNINLTSRINWSENRNDAMAACMYSPPICGCDMTPSTPLVPYTPSYPEVQDYYWKTYYPIVNYTRSKVDDAFKIIKKLQEKGYLKIDTVEEFIKAVDLIAGEM